MNQMERLEQYSATCAYHFSLSELFTWENRQAMPPDGAPYRQAMMQSFGDLAHAFKTGAQACDLLAWLNENPPEDAIHQAMYRDLRHNLALVDVPADLIAERQRLVAQATLAWEEANHANDARLWLPHVQCMMDNSREIAHAAAPGSHPFEFWLNQYEFDLPLSDLENLFGSLQRDLAALRAVIPANAKLLLPETSWGMTRLLPFCRQLAAAAGYDERIGRWGETRLPFSSIIGPSDVRIAVNFSSPYQAFSGTLHEAGHAVYAAGANPAYHANGLWMPLIGGYDEAMAILWERMIGQSKEFWQFFYPRLQTEFSEFKLYSLDDFLVGFKVVQPSPVRAGADEITYSLHILIRFELEKRFLKGDLAAADLPDAWNQLYERYLGLHPGDDRSGCLQDIHWSLGLVGYFPSYLLGSLMAAQLYAALRNSNVLASVADGDFNSVRQWLAEHCYQQGRLCTPTQILQKATGGSLDAACFVQYLRKKYQESARQ